ncbi:MAG: glycosyltransferase, partial [Sedimentisphaerales bacterium]|nr:glycosyltransferase [Sedimentisphaerales bacterium]
FKWSLKKAALVFVQNQSDKLNLKKTFMIDPVVIPNAHRIKIDEHKDRKHILWTGRSVASKQPEIFIELAKNNPQYQFVMICQKATNDNNYQRLAKLACDITNLELIERVPFSQIHTFFEQALAFVNTSTAEGFPNTFIQACIASTPILSLTVNPDGFLEKFDCGLCANSDQNKLNPCLQQLLENFDHYHTTTRNYALENHNIEKVVRSYILHLGN